MTVQAHSYSEMPFGAWDTGQEADVFSNDRESAIARLMRPSVGATSRAQAEVLVDEIGTDVIRSESDELLAARVAAPEGVVHNPDQAVIAEILAEVGDDPVKAQVALDAEQAGKNRVTLVSSLEAIVASAGESSTPAQEPTADGESGVGDRAGVEPDTAADQGGPQVEEAAADGEPNTA